jgi:hypothetical protein
VQAVTYTLENTTAKPLTVTIEAPTYAGLELFETPSPDVETASERRWRVNIAAHSQAEFTRKERRLRRRHQELRRLDYQNLQHFFKNRWLDQVVFERLSEMRDNLGLIQRAHARQGELESERKTIYEQQEQLRANLKTLQPTGQEAAFRNRLLSQLEGTQNRLDEIEQQQHDLAQQITEAEARIDEIIASLGQSK